MSQGSRNCLDFTKCVSLLNRLKAGHQLLRSSMKVFVQLAYRLQPIGKALAQELIAGESPLALLHARP
jgi:hypothetical protein